MVPHLPKMILAELRAVFSRASGLGALIVAFTVGALTLAGVQWVISRGGDAQVNGANVTQMVDATWVGTAGYALKARNFFILPMVLILAVGNTFSLEIGDQSLREVLVRPVTRWSVMLAKVLALTALSACTLLVTWTVSALGGAALFGATGSILDVSLGYLASLASDVGLIALTTAVAVFFRGVGGVVVSVVIALMVDMAARGVLKLVGALGAEAAKEASKFLPGAALACWEGWKGGEWEPTSFIGLGVLISACFTIAMVRFQRMDVP